jgi:hypothetical protein
MTGHKYAYRYLRLDLGLGERVGRIGHHRAHVLARAAGLLAGHERHLQPHQPQGHSAPQHPLSAAAASPGVELCISLSGRIGPAITEHRSTLAPPPPPPPPHARTRESPRRFTHGSAALTLIGRRLALADASASASPFSPRRCFRPFLPFFGDDAAPFSAAAPTRSPATHRPCGSAPAPTPPRHSSER